MNFNHGWTQMDTDKNKRGGAEKAETRKEKVFLCVLAHPCLSVSIRG
jgi:hypothetical protein